MPIDTSMYQAFGVKPKSVADYQDEFAAQEDKQAARESNRLALMIQKGQYGDQLAQRERGNRLMTLAQGVSDPQELIQRMRNNGFHAEADAALKRQADIGKEKADADRAAQAAEKDRLANLYTKIDRHTQGLAMVQNPQGLAQWIMEGVSSGVMEQAKADQLLSQPPRNQQEFDALKERLRQGGLTLSQQVEQAWKAKDFGLKANNELIAPDGTVNQTVVRAKAGIAKAGAPSVTVNTEKSYAGNVAEGLAKNDVAALDAARSAPDRVRTARSIKQVLDSNKALTGTAASVRLELVKALSTAGIVNADSTTATEDLVSMLNSQTLDAIKTAGMGSGQGFTDKDRQFLQDAKSGRIEINAASLRRMADLNEKAGLATIEYGNKIAKRLKGNPAMGTVGQDLEVKAPDDPFQKAIDDEAKRRGLK